MITKERAEEISQMYYHEIFRYCMAMSQNRYHDAKEITQDVFLVFLEKRKNLKDDKIDRWLISTARFKCLEYFRRIKNEEMVISLEDSFTSPEELLYTISKYSDVSDADIRMTLEIILKMLTEEEYTLYQKKFIENKTQSEISEEMGIPVSTVNTKIARLRKKIQKLGFLCFTFVGQLIIKNFF